MKKFLSIRKKKAIISAVAAGICFSGGNAEAVEQVNIDWNGKTLFNIKYYGTSDYTESRAAFFRDGNNTPLNYDLTSDIKSGLNKAFKWWTEILGPGAIISQPAQYFVGTYSNRNAGALALTSKYHFTDIFRIGQTVPQFNDVSDYQNNEEYYKSTGFAFGKIFIGQNIAFDYLNNGNYGFSNTEYFASPTPELMIGADISAIMYHEIGHSLGILADRELYEVLPDKNYIASYFKNFNEKSFTAHLYDQYGRQAKPEYVILASADDISAFNQLAPSSEDQLTYEKTFIVDNSKAARDSGKIYMYFAGDNVTEVLDGRTFTRADGQQISGIPINLWEDMETDKGTFDYPEFSHLELERSMMSHQRYRSYLTYSPRINAGDSAINNQCL